MGAALESTVLVVARNIRESVGQDEYVTAVRKHGYLIQWVSREQDPLPLLHERKPIAACFHFDYPDLRGLAELRYAKEHAPSVPLLMVTQAHSESLAVWAFRAKVWDYFAQPVDLKRFLAVLAALAAMRSPTKGNREQRQAFVAPDTLPAEARVRDQKSGNRSPVFDSALTYIDRHLHEKLTQAEMAALCKLSTFQFSREFKRHSGTTFQGYLLDRRINEAKRLLQHPGASVTDVCFSVGFRDLSYFTRAFQRRVGMAPSQYRRSLTLPGSEARCPQSKARLNARSHDGDAAHNRHVPVRR